MSQSYMTRTVAGYIVPWQEIEELRVVLLDCLVKFVLAVVELLADRSFGEAIHC